MFDAVRNNPKITQIFLLAITLPFAFWGVESYVRGGGSDSDVAKVGGSEISQREFSQALRDQQERLRANLGKQFNPAMLAMLETPEARRAVLDNLTTARLLMLHAGKSNLVASDDTLRAVVSSMPTLQEDGKFSMQRYEQSLRAQGLTQAGFEHSLRQEITRQQIVSAVAGTAIVSRAAAERVLAVQREEREVSEVVIQPERFVAQVKVGADAAKDFYEKNRKLFEIPEQIRAEYVVLSLEDLARSEQVSPEDVKKFFESGMGAKTRERAAAKQKAEELLKDVRKDPKRFAELAKASSQDSGTAEKGGDLGFFGRGAMVKPFEDAVFKMKEGAISDLVESDFGFHIIMVTGIRRGKDGEERQASHILLSKPSGTKDFEAARAEIEAELKRQAVAKKFAEAADGFTNTIYEQADSLKPAAEKYKLTISQTGFFDKTNRADAGLLGSADKLIAALFSEDAIKNKRNTEAVEVAANTLIAARVLDHKPAGLRSFEEVKAVIEKRLAAEDAAKLAQKEGEAHLARLAQGQEAGLTWSSPQTVPRQGARDLRPEVVKAAFKAPSDKLPSHAGVALADGTYVLVRVSKVTPGSIKDDDAGAKPLRSQLAQMSGSADLEAYLAALRVRYPVTINKAALDSKER